MGHSTSNAQMIDKTGLEATLLSITHQAESREALLAEQALPPHVAGPDDHMHGQHRLQVELQRIEHQKKLISSYLPKDYDHRRAPSPLSPTMAAHPQQVGHVEAGQESGPSNSSFGNV